MLSDASDPIRDGDQFAQGPIRPRAARPRIGERWVVVGPAQETRLIMQETFAIGAINRVRQLDTNWRPTPRIANSAEEAIERAVAEMMEANARWDEITRDVWPGANPIWGVNRLRSELNARGFTFERPTSAPSLFYSNPTSNEQLRIMNRPSRQYRNDPVQKHSFEQYYRYRRSVNDPWGAAIPIPDKDKKE